MEEQLVCSTTTAETRRLDNQACCCAVTATQYVLLLLLDTIRCSKVPNILKPFDNFEQIIYELLYNIISF